MVLVLIIGDLHIPHRTHDLPAKFKKLLEPAYLLCYVLQISLEHALYVDGVVYNANIATCYCAPVPVLQVPGKIQQIICTGNVSDKETYEYLRTVCPDVNVVRGDYDDAAFPYSITLVHSPIRIGVIHGHQSVPVGDLDSLAGIARQMDVDVLVSGHTHVVQAVEHDSRFFVNPGSATGAWSGASSADVTPSFALMDIQGPVVVTYIYQLVDQEPPVRVEKVEWRKPETLPLPPPPAPPAQSPTSGIGVGVGSVW